MCYSRDWDTNERRKRQEADAEANRKRDGVIKTLLTDAGKAAAAKTETAPTKETTFSK